MASVQSRLTSLASVKLSVDKLDAKSAEHLRKELAEVKTAQDPDTPLQQFKVTIPHLCQLLGRVLEAIPEMAANAAKARVDLAERVNEMIAAHGSTTPELEANAERLARQIDEMEARKRAEIELWAVKVENSLEKLTKMVADAEEALVAFDAKS